MNIFYLDVVAVQTFLIMQLKFVRNAILLKEAKDFEESLNQVKPSVSPETAKRYKKLEDYYLKNVKAGLEIGPLYTG